MSDELIYVPVFTDLDGLPRIPTSADYFEISEATAQQAGMELLELLEGSGFQPAGVLFGKAGEIRGMMTDRLDPIGELEVEFGELKKFP